MRVAEELSIEPKIARATDQLHAAAPLDANRNPFAAGAPGMRLGRPAQTAFGELVRLIGLRTRVVVVLGKPGTGKTVLVSMVARACAEMGLSVRKLERGDLLTEAAADASDVLFVDEADSMSNAMLQSFLSASAWHPDRTTVFMCLPSCIGRFSFSGTEAAVVELSPLSLLDARLYLTERGNSIGRPKLFTPRALDIVIDASRGVPRLLRSVAGLAYFNAAAEGASQIDSAHAQAAAQMRNEFVPAPATTPHAISADSEPPLISDHPEFQPADPGESSVEANADAANAASAEDLETTLHTDVFVPANVARDGWSLRMNRTMLAIAAVLLIASAGNFAMLSGHGTRNTAPKPVSPSPAVAVALPAHPTAPQPPRQDAFPSTAAPTQSASAAATEETQTASAPDSAPTQSAPDVESSPALDSNSASTQHTPSAPTQHTPLAVAAATKSASRAPAEAKPETEDPVICAFAQASRDPRALPLAGRCPGAPSSPPRSAALGSPVPRPMPRAADVYLAAPPKAALPASDPIPTAQSAPTEPVRTTDITHAQVPAPAEAALPPPPQRSDLPVIVADHVPPQGVTAAEQEAPAPERGSPVVIFGRQLWHW